MRAIQVSADVFQAIWAHRKPGQDNEDEILRDILKLPRTRDVTVTHGFHDARYGVQLPVGFTIKRDYKGTRYTAQAIAGFWVSSKDAKGYPTLNELNKSIGIAGAENAWNAWWYEDGVRRRPLSELRDQSKIVRRA